MGFSLIYGQWVNYENEHVVEVDGLIEEFHFISHEVTDISGGVDRERVSVNMSAGS